MIGWKEDKRWSDRFLPEIKMILGLHLIGEPPVEEDQERNTDLMVLRMDAVRIGCRVRRFKYVFEYSDEFTIRCGRPSGAKTELAKIIEGWGRYFFYGFCDENVESLAAWSLLDMNVFRSWYASSLYAGRKPGVKQMNRDGSSGFLAFSIDDLPKGFVIARK